MISEKQLQANRKNALHSTGPRTAEGKAVVSGNALRHGFRSQRVVIDGECTDEYNDFRNELIARFAPVDILETMLAERAVAGFWRLQRAGRMETEMLELMQSSDRHDQAATVFTEQTHFDPPTNDPPPAITQPARSLGDVVAADLRGANTILKLKRYEAHIERSLFRTLAKLEHLQEKRLAKEAKDDEPMDIEPEPIRPSRQKSEFLRRGRGRK